MSKILITHILCVCLVYTSCLSVFAQIPGSPGGNPVISGQGPDREKIEETVEDFKQKANEGNTKISNTIDHLDNKIDTLDPIKDSLINNVDKGMDQGQELKESLTSTLKDAKNDLVDDMKTFIIGLVMSILNLLIIALIAPFMLISSRAPSTITYVTTSLLYIAIEVSFIKMYLDLVNNIQEIMNKKIPAIQKSMGNIQNEVTNAQTGIGNLQKNISSAQGKVGDMTTKGQGLVTSGQGLVNDGQNLGNSGKELVDNASQLGDTNDLDLTNVKGTKDKLDKTQESYDKVGDDYDKFKGSYDGLNSDYQDLQEDYHSLRKGEAQGLIDNVGEVRKAGQGMLNEGTDILDAVKYSLDTFALFRKLILAKGINALTTTTIGYSVAMTLAILESIGIIPGYAYNSIDKKKYVYKPEFFPKERSYIDQFIPNAYAQDFTPDTEQFQETAKKGQDLMDKGQEFAKETQTQVEGIQDKATKLMDLTEFNKEVGDFSNIDTGCLSGDKAGKMLVDKEKEGVSEEDQKKCEFIDGQLKKLLNPGMLAVVAGVGVTFLFSLIGTIVTSTSAGHNPIWRSVFFGVGIASISYRKPISSWIY